ncbi:hypothetical protein E3T39_07355 [Cryobacterium suzukii]|uniref:PIN domain-containing protein n=1 Tax=Cryobacterium suzukii TaxID=1259198 RepID=A0A4R9AG81_9MICO|nr:hypothetical protein [Cryobacterium suzukii]TFD60920.1 hypothetical protein E3T39_07355 [Cryobacterium suzukii]
MNETKYLVDNNALVALKGDRIRTDFFHAFCRVTADVLFEADLNPEQAAIAQIAHEPTPEVLEQIRAVMGTVLPGDTRLIDLYKNKGAADPGLIALILATIAAGDGMFFSDTWVLVTNDNAVTAKATEFGVASIKPGDLAALIDGSRT